MAIQTLRGAASVLQSTDSASERVNQVASEGGTTDAALRVLRKHQLHELLGQAVSAAAERSRELRGV